MTNRLRRSALPDALASGGLPGRIDPYRDSVFGTAAVNLQLDLLADPGQADRVAQLGAAAHRLAVDRHHQIAAVQTGALGRRAGIDAGDHRARGVRRIHALREIRRQILDHDADAAALHFAESDELLHDAARHGDRHREADADIAAARRQDRGIDADALALQVDQRAARIALVDRRVGLDEILVALDAEAAAA